MDGSNRCGRPSEELLQGLLLPDADDRAVAAGHPRVGDVGRAAGEDLLVGGRDVGVGPDDGRNAAVEVPAEGLLLRGRLGVEVDDDDRRLLPQGLDLGVRPAEGAVDGFHEDPALEIEDGDLDAAAVLEDIAAAAGVALRIIGGAEEARLPLEVGQGLLLVPDVVARGQDVDLEEQVPPDLLRDARCRRRRSRRWR